MIRWALVVGLVAACGPTPSSELGHHVVLEPGASPRLVRFDLPEMADGGRVESVRIEVLRATPGADVQVTVLAGPVPPDPELASAIDLSRAHKQTAQGTEQVQAPQMPAGNSPQSRHQRIFGRRSQQRADPTVLFGR